MEINGLVRDDGDGDGDTQHTDTRIIFIIIPLECGSRFSSPLVYTYTL